MAFLPNEGNNNNNKDEYMYALGIDIGSTATKVVVVDQDKRMVGSAISSLGAGTSGADQALTQLFRETGLSWEELDAVVATGYGRQRFERADKQVSEISCHARGVVTLIPGIRTIIDIGGQDVKALRLKPDGALDTFMMNEKCAAGTGRFLDVMARVLESDVSQLGALDAQSSSPVEISSTCTVFAESEVISHLAQGEPIADIVAGIHNSVAKRTAGLVRRLGPVQEPVAMSGGVAKNSGVVRALEHELGTSIVVCDISQLCGALGAALAACDLALKRSKH